MDDRIKSTFELNAPTKRKLAMLRLDLRYAGYRATERSIVEALIQDTTIEALRKLLPRGDRKARQTSQRPTRG